MRFFNSQQGSVQIKNHLKVDKNSFKIAGFVLFSLFLMTSNGVASTQQCDPNYCGDQVVSPDLASSHRIELQSMRGPHAYHQYVNLIREMGELVKLANQKSKTYRERAISAFIKKDYEGAKQNSKFEIAFYPIGFIKNFEFRIFSTPSLHSEEWLTSFPDNFDPFLPPNRVDIEDGKFAYFYKSLSKSQLCKLQKSGLDSKFGGVGGASEKVGSSMAATHDRGRMFLTDGFSEKMGYSKIFEDEGPSTVLVRLPLAQTLLLNLTWNRNEWFIAGTSISPDWIYVYYNSSLQLSNDAGPRVENESLKKHGKTFIPVSFLDCSEIHGIKSKF